MIPKYTIDFTELAKESYEHVIDFICLKGPINVALRVEAKVDELINNLKYHKHFCPPSPKFPLLRRCTITTYTYLIYRVNSESNIIEIVAFFDNRMDG